MSMARKIFFFTLVAIAWTLSAGLCRAAEHHTEGNLLGSEVASTQSQHDLHVKLPTFVLNGITLKQDRNRPTPKTFQDPGSRKCPPFCVQPDTLPGATTIQVEDFPKMANDIQSGKILVVDMRTPDWFQKGTIPGAINLPYSDLTGPKSKALARLKKLDGKDIIVFCNGWWCGQSPTGIKALTGMGYTGKIYYFRSGNQGWVDAGLPFSIP